MLILALRILFIIIFVAILGVNIRAISMESLFEIPSPVTSDPWFTSTLVDAYAGFLTFYAWVVYKSPTMATRILWLVLIMLGGNIAMSAYMLILLFKLPISASAADILLRSEDKRLQS
jgi:hypothetical protein